MIPPNPYAHLDDAALCAEARRVEEPATRGPWRRIPSLGADSCVESEVQEHGNPALTVGISAFPGDRANADFIAASRSLVPELRIRLERANARANAARLLYVSGWGLFAGAIMADGSPRFIAFIASEIRRLSAQPIEDDVSATLKALDALATQENSK